MLPNAYVFSGAVMLPPFSRTTSPAFEGDILIEATPQLKGRHPLIAHLYLKGQWHPLDLAACPPQLRRITRDRDGKLLINRNLYRLAAILSAYRGKSPVVVREPAHSRTMALMLPASAVTARFEPLPGLLASLEAEGHA